MLSLVNVSVANLEMRLLAGLTTNHSSASIALSSRINIRDNYGDNAMRYYEILTQSGLHEIADLEQQRIKAQTQAAKRQTAAAKRADLTHRIQKLQKQLSDLNAKPI